MSAELRCEQVRELAPEVALDIAGGKDRDAALRHIGVCAGCRSYVAELSEVTDELLLLAPDHEPPEGFATRTLARIVEPGPRSVQAAVERAHRRPRWRFAVAAVAAFLLAVALGAGWTYRATSGDRNLAAGYRSLLAEGHGSFFAVATLRGPDGPAGTVFGYQGRPSWLFATVSGAATEEGPFRVQLVTRDGRYVPLGVADLGGGDASWGRAIPVDLTTVLALRFQQIGGPAVYAASFNAQNPWPGG